MRAHYWMLFLLSACGAEVSQGVEASTSRSGASAEEVRAVEAVILEWNAAISRRDLGGMMDCLMDGAVQVQIESPHFGFGKPELTKDLATSWQQVASLLFQIAESYVRTVSELETRIDGDLATVWAAVHAETQMQSDGEVIVRDFREAYWLTREGDAWKLAAVVNSRTAGDAGSKGEALASATSATHSVH